MQQRSTARYRLDRFAGQLGQSKSLAQLAQRPAAQEEPPPPEPAALVLWRELHERLRADYGARADGLGPMLKEPKAQLIALFPVEVGAALTEDQHLECQAQVEALCAALEDVMYGLSLSSK